MKASGWQRYTLLATALGLLTGCASASPGAGDAPRATATLVDATGATVGSAELVQQGDSVVIAVAAGGLPTGLHGIHIHETGVCEAGADFASAGGHFNPAGRQHGLDNPGGPHAGDLPNLEVLVGGTADYRAVSDLVSLTPGPRSLFDADGSALVIHAAADDQETDPSGDSGARLVCGVLESAEG
ncbi:MAG: superoxide dismutase family protein [Longimicrobiales bacterium]